MDKKNKQRFIIKFCCVIASFCLWLYITNVENPVQTYRVKNIPIKFQNLSTLKDSKLTLLDKDSYNISLTVKGNSTEVFNLKPSDFEVVADLKGYAVKRGTVKIPVEVKKSPNYITILSDDTLWVEVNIDELVEKSVPIKSNIKSYAQKGYAALEPEFSTKNVLVSGPSQYINDVQYGLVEGNFQNLYTDEKLTLPITPVGLSEKAIENVTVDPEKIQITIPVKRAKTVPIKVITTNSHSNDMVVKSTVSSPSKVDVVGDENVVSHLEYIETMPIDLNKLGNDGAISTRLKVPNGVKLVNSNGFVRVSFQINKNTTKEFTLDVKTTNLTTGYKAKLSSTSVNITVSAKEDILNSLSKDSIKCYVDLSNFTEGKYTLPINIGLPDGVKLENSTPTDTVANITKIISGSNTPENSNN